MCNSITYGTGNDLLSQIASVVGAGFSKAYFSNVYFGSLSGNYIGITARTGQDGIGYSCWFNVTLSAPNQITACTSSWAGTGQRWGGMHGLFNTKTAAGWGEQFNVPLNIQGETGIGLYQLSINSIAGETGTTALTANVATDPTTITCPPNPYGVTGFLCFQMTVATEPQNVAPSATDASMWPSSCHSGWAQLQAMQPGDNFVDGSSLFGEQFLILTKTGSGCSPITLVVARGQTQGCASGPVAHGTGGSGIWTPVMQATAQCNGNVYWFQESAPTVSYPDPPGIDSGHVFIGQSDGTGTNLIQYSAYSAFQGYNSYGARQGSLPSIISQGYNYGMNEIYPFAGTSGIPSGYIQSHPGSQSYLANNPTLGYDGRPIGQAGGCTEIDCLAWYHTLTLQAGTTNTYLITCPAASPGGSCIDTASPKTLGWEAWAGRFLLTDISGPSSSISDSNPYTSCYAYAAGECRSGSAAGNRYVSVPNADTGGICYYNAPDRNAPCLVAAQSFVGQVTQYSWNQNDPNAALWRPLGYAFNGPGQTSNEWNWHGIVDGSWIFGDASWKEGVRTDIVAIQLPPWPSTDTVVRSGFVPIPITVAGKSGTSARVRFGYNSSLYCTSRQESCATSAPTLSPFAYLSEYVSGDWTTCSSTCTVNIPAFAGEGVYYVVDRLIDGVVNSGQMQWVGAP